MTEREMKYNAFVRDDIASNRGRIVNSIAELDYLIANPQSCEILSAHYLNDILTYAAGFSEFYRYCRGFTALQDFPLIDKETMKQNWDAIAVPEYDSQITTKYTSGSTGTPFKIILDRYKHSRWIAVQKVFRANVGVKSHEKTLFMSGTIRDKFIPPERMERDNVYYMDCRYFDRGAVNELIDYLTDNHFRSMTALASALDRIAHLYAEGRLKEWTGDFAAIFSVSETLKESTRRLISEYFRCPVYVFYANEENGVLGVEDGSGLGLRANTADFCFEVLKMDSDDPADDGEMGRLVITDYFNKAFPVIRYENGDIVSMKRMQDGRVYFSQIAGRKADMLYTTDGRMVYYFRGISFLEPYMDIKQFQLIQEDYHNFTWVLNTKNTSYEKMITEYCRNLFGQDSSYRFEYVDEIPKLRSGKTRMTVCRIKDRNER